MSTRHVRREVAIERWPLARTFRTARIARTHTTVVVLRLRDGEHVGVSEHVPYERYGERPERVAAQLRAMPLDPAAIARLAPGASRAALSDALLDLEAKRRGERVWTLLGEPTPHPVASMQSLGADTPERMAEQATRWRGWSTLKLKASGDAELDLARVRAVHEAMPSARLVVDANESWTTATYERLVPRLAELGVALIEQPFPAGADEALARLPRPIPVCADESCHVARDVPRLADRYDAINVKIGKSGGLVGALATIRAAKRERLAVMVGCMVSTSLALAPAVIAAQHADFVDLDGASLLARDRVGSRAHTPWIAPAVARVWG